MIQSAKLGRRNAVVYSTLRGKTLCQNQVKTNKNYKLPRAYLIAVPNALLEQVCRVLFV
jgi:hypothetical protein